MSLLLLLSLAAQFVSYAPSPPHVGVSASAQETDILDGLSEFRIGVTDDGLDVPDELLIGYTELELRDRPGANLDSESELTKTSRAVFALHLVRVSPGEPVSSPESDQTIVGTDVTLTQTADIRPEVLIVLERTTPADVPLDLVQVPGDIAFAELDAAIQSGDRPFEWLDDTLHRPGLPVAADADEVAEAVVTIPFTFPQRSTYLLFSASDSRYAAVYQAIGVLHGPGCALDFAVDIHSGECEPLMGNAGNTDGPSTEGADVVAWISANAIIVEGGPLELGRQTWAVVNTTPDARTFTIYRFRNVSSIDPSLRCQPSSQTGIVALAELGIDQQFGLTEFTGSDPRKVIVKLGPGSYVVTSVVDLPNGDTEARGCFFELAE
ncbi:MAG: hypothetical protein IT335_03400 [Thermomicrobiales bacterium]|nr:hypothetical protein [Thermomicrobiales bacterium]